ncbi:hypothetical protein [Kineosporia sp. NBRC 101731]|uniref:hypothetical protein n=1 Tax=Kineosporia sp. NBRC 101731 TaxID=3032199 RepID=UPI0024A16AF0|nr:hypothetical protein [Kineosporia sp. NBRC 101731]GLY29332.1 hypothetical protein Kisp02_26970 [Kineosporia sp. NBRC 101731]
MAVSVVAVNLPTDPESWPGRTSAAPHQRIDVELAGWSVRSNADSTLTITLRDPHLFDFQHPQLIDEDRLTSTLASAGVPIVLEFHDLTAQGGVLVDCHDTGDDLEQQVVVQDPGASDGSDGHSWVITLRPDRLPQGAVVKLVLTADRTTIVDKNGQVSHGYGWGTAVMVFPGTPPACTLTRLPDGDLP